MKAALFDLDGVVIDTEPQYTIFWGGQFRLYYPAQPGLEHKIKGQTLTQIFDAYFSGPLEKERETIVARLNQFESQMDFVYIDGFPSFIAKLREQGVKTALVTSSNLAKMEAVYASHPEIRQMFDEILTSEDFARSKPDPDCYLKAAARFGADISDCVVFEDSVNGVRSGHASGAKVVGVLSSDNYDQILPYTDRIIKSYKEL